jgi:hypothetical protein
LAVLAQLQAEGHEVVLTHAGYIHYEEDTFTCECRHTGDDVHHNDDMYTVHEAGEQGDEVGGGQSWSRVAAHCYAFHCDWSEEWYADDIYSRVRVEGETVCQEANENTLTCEYYWWESDEEYHADPERSSGIPEYHGSAKPWKYDRNVIPHHALGVELECWSRDRVDTYEFATSLGLEGEEDGSLCEENGIEIIGAPMLLEEYHRKSNPWMRFCEEATDVKCWFGRNGIYGQHISANTRDVSQLTLARAIVFIHDNEEFVTRLAGRESQSYGFFKKGVKCSNARREAQDSHNATQLKRGNRLEFRFFKANRRWHGFLKNVEFVHAVMAFAKDNPIADCHADPFTRWVGHQTKRWNTYPTLTAWLANTNL